MPSEVILPRPAPRRNDDGEDIILVLRKELQTRKTIHAQIERSLHDFTTRLHTAFENAVETAIQQGAPSLAKPRRIPHPSGDWRQALQLFVEDFSVIIVPMTGVAWPNPRDEARIQPARFKEPAGRIAFFWGDDPTETSFYDFLIFPDGMWFAWGYGWPRTQDAIDYTDFETMAYELLTSFVRDIHSTWRPRAETPLGMALDPKRHAYRLGRPGEE